jgi:hypothetical protein
MRHETEMWEVGSWKLEVGSGKLEVGRLKNHLFFTYHPKIMVHVGSFTIFGT